MNVIWTDFALQSLREIFVYYKENVSQKIANNIKAEIFNATKQLKIQPFSGAIDELLQVLNEEHRYLIVKNYKIIYKILDKKVYITDVFDTRQNPEKLIVNNSNDYTLNEPSPLYSAQ